MAQSLAAAAAFFYSSYLGLYLQLAILLVLAICGTITFVVVEWRVKKEEKGSDEEEEEEEE